MESRDKTTGRFLKGISASPATQFQKGQHWRVPKPHWNKEWLYRQYVELGLSSSDVAIGCGCSENNIHYWLHKHGIPRRSISEARDKKHWGLTGEANGMFGKRGGQTPNWKGGLTPSRQLLYASIEWSKTVSVVWKRDKAKCRRCGIRAKESPMHIHHVASFRFKALRSDPSNLVLLCIECHRFVHSRKNVKSEYIRENILDI